MSMDFQNRMEEQIEPIRLFYPVEREHNVQAGGG